MAVDFSSLTPLEGGWSGQTFLAEAAGERSVVRIYPPGGRGEAAAEIDAAVLRLVRGLVPVPEVLEVRPARPEADQPGLLVTSFLPGVRGDELLPTLDAGWAGARWAPRWVASSPTSAGCRCSGPGPSSTRDLTIGDFGLDGLPEYVETRLPELGHLTPEEIDGLREVALDAQVLLDTVPRAAWCTATSTRRTCCSTRTRWR